LFNFYQYVYGNRSQICPFIISVKSVYIERPINGYISWKLLPLKELICVLIPPIHSLDMLVESLLYCVLLGFVAMTMAYTCLLQSWMNFGAEMTCFADRQFYTDWWNCKNYATYYRNWNMPIYEWLHVYIYRDLRKVSLDY